MNRRLTVAAPVLLLALNAGAQTSTEAPRPRPEHWAVPITLEGVPNLHRLTPTLYRSEQPTALGFRNLEKLGIRTVINLRAFNSDDDEARGTNLRTERIRIYTWNIDDRHVVDVMRVLLRAEDGPFLIHCQHGADRTGLMSAMYRVLEQDWTVDDALAELTGGGYGYHAVWKNIVRYVREVDIEKLRAAIVAGAPGKGP